MSNEDECGWYNSANTLCTCGSVETLSLSENNLVGTILNELALLSNLGESSVVWLLVVMIVLSCVFFIVLSCLLVIFHSTAWLDLSGNSLKGTIPSQLAMMPNLCESSIVFGCLFVMICVVMCFSLYSHACFCHFSFYSCVVSLCK
jgi:hypothetical protein